MNPLRLSHARSIPPFPAKSRCRLVGISPASRSVSLLPVISRYFPLSWTWNPGLRSGFQTAREMPDEQPLFLSKSAGADRTFDQVVLDLQTSVLQKPSQCFPSLERVVNVLP